MLSAQKFKSLVTLVCILHTQLRELEIALKFKSRAFTPPMPDRQQFKLKTHSIESEIKEKGKGRKNSSIGRHRNDRKY